MTVEEHDYHTAFTVNQGDYRVELLERGMMEVVDVVR
jgi:hypothetical protein